MTVLPQGSPTLVQTSAASAVVVAPAGIAVGEIILLALTHQNQAASADWTLPGGWVRFGTPWIQNDANQRGNMLAYHVVTSADVAAQAAGTLSWTFTYPSGSGRLPGWARRFSGVDTANPDAGHSVGNPASLSGATRTLPGFSVVADNAYLVVLANDQLVSPNAEAASADSGMTQLALVSSLAGADNTTVTRTMLALYGKQLGVAGAAPTPTVTWPAATGASIMSVALRPAAATNQPPVPSFTHSEAGLGTTVNASGSADQDGTIASYDWDWGDASAHGSGVEAAHTYAAPGTYTVKLTVTDNGGATASTQTPVTVKHPTAVAQLGGAQAYVWLADGAGGKQPVDVFTVGDGAGTPTQLLAKTGFVFGHMGESYDEVEGSLEGVTRALMHGADGIMVSLQRTSDGVFFVLNDEAYLDRMTLGVSGGTTLDPRTMTWAQVQGYDQGSYWTKRATSSPRRPYLNFAALLAAYPSLSPIMVDPKTIPSTYFSAILDVMDANGGPARFIAKNYITGTTWRAAAKARGYLTWGYGYGANQGTTEDWATLAPGWDWLGLDVAATQAQWNTALAYGKPVIGHIASSKAMYDSGMSKGASGIMASGVREVRGYA
ncbi:PKD domain-containing protein [Leifsonia virtsii]|uniref:PKD domain-containing protein n=1 Tax=Leifsonia virtsii TaxID=3035915 RepID=A0ABT8J1F1_9MICO|nr:PKD domain-containing protein [Leifsonia virtsii]MDN4598441.1 PKD domain-containing protein [Leifsonia virtsii]